MTQILDSHGLTRSGRKQGSRPSSPTTATTRRPQAKSSVDFTRFADALGIDVRRVLGVHQGARRSVTVFYAPEIHEGPDAPIHVSHLVSRPGGKLTVVARLVPSESPRQHAA